MPGAAAVTGARILIADEHALTREALGMAARAAMPGAQVVGVGSVAEAAVAMSDRRTFRLVLLDARVPGAYGYAGMLMLQRIDPEVPIVIVGTAADARAVAAARALGAAGFLFESVPLDEMAAILREVLRGGDHFPEDVGDDPVVAAARARIVALSRAQFGVLLALAGGGANKKIAFDLSITEATVKAHLTAIFRKLGVTNRGEAVRAIRPLLEAGERLAPA